MLKNNLFNRKKFFKRLPTGRIFRGKLKPKLVPVNPTPKLFYVSKPNRLKRLKSKLLVTGLVFILLLSITIISIKVFQPELPKISFDFNNLFGQYVSPNLPKSPIPEKSAKKSFEEQISEQLNPDLFKVKDVIKVEGGLEYGSMEGVKAIFTDQKDPTDQVTSLQTVLSRARIEGRKVKKLDFRFDKLVVEYE